MTWIRRRRPSAPEVAAAAVGDNLAVQLFAKVGRQDVQHECLCLLIVDLGLGRR